MRADYIDAPGEPAGYIDARRGPAGGSMRASGTTATASAAAVQ